jgi:hypothetical protein
MDVSGIRNSRTRHRQITAIPLPDNTVAETLD